SSFQKKPDHTHQESAQCRLYMTDVHHPAHRQRYDVAELTDHKKHDQSQKDLTCISEYRRKQSVNLLQDGMDLLFDDYP
ncbi:hypothetical protein, partial [Novacetimonas pomaceti]|uniref:hypothetical protein n=1 Tax=Novacetimonas pomaceti TaxID=2021998 RepID=UPI001EF04554